MKKKILITGASGFIGFHLCLRLQNEFSIVAVDNLSNYYDINLKKSRANILKNLKIKFYKYDLTNQKHLQKLFSLYDFDYIIHLAAQAGVRYSFENPNSYVDNNILATFNILECIKKKKIKHFLFASTSSVYGISDKIKGFKETDSANFQVSLYASSKKSAESLIHNYSYNFKIKATIFRFFTVYGPWGRPDMALFKFTDSIINNRPIKIYNHGNQYRDFTYVDDLTESIKRLVNCYPIESNRVKNDSLSDLCPYRIVNIGNQKAIYLKDFVNTIENVIGKKAKKTYVKKQLGDVPFTLSDSSLLKRLTGYVPNTSLTFGIEKFYSWYKDYYNL